MTTIQLKNLLNKGEAAIAATSVLLAQGLATLDCQEVESLTEPEIAALFSAIPGTWDFADLGNVIAPETVSETLAEQFLQHFDTQPVQPVEVSNDLTIEVSADSVSSAPLHPIRILEEVTQEYSDYLRTEFRAKDPELKAALERELDQPLFLAQEPFFQAHRPFKSGQLWQNLPIDAKLATVLQHRSGSDRAYSHQSEAITHLLSPNASPLVVTTGTGSGKTESFLVPVIQNAIADAVQFKKAGLTAVLVYPMNALANDQLLRIETYLRDSGWEGAITVKKYDRGTKEDERRKLRENPPHILLTNYMMLEYLLVRPADRDAIFANHRCRFLVLDEAHTYRGTLGSNIALLIRRFRAHLQNAKHDWNPNPPETVQSQRYPALLPVGASATIKSITDETIAPEERLRLRDAAVQDFFSKLSGAAPETIKVVGEELEEIVIPTEATYSASPIPTADLDITDIDAVHHTLRQLSGQPNQLTLDETARQTRLLWDLNRWLSRAPLSISQVVGKIKTEIPQRQGCSDTDLQREVKSALTVGAALPDGSPGALRLRAHRLIRGGWQFHRCVNPKCGKLHPMGEDHCSACRSATAPLFLCRNCGAHYLRFVGEHPTDPTQGVLNPSADRSEDFEWMLYDPNRFETTVEDDDTAEPTTPSNRRQTQQMRKRPVCQGSFDPATLAFSSDRTQYSLPVTLAPARTRCLCCGGTAGSRNVITPVALGTSAAVKVLSEGLVEALAAAGHSKDDKQRLLVFSDSRQDAAHQARFIIFASRYDRMRRRLLKILETDSNITLERAVELLGDAAIRERDSKYVPENPRARINDETLKRIRAYEEAPLLDEIAVNAGYRASLVNLGLLRVSYEQLSEFVQTNGTEIAQQLSISLDALEHLCICLLDEIRVRGCLSRELLQLHPVNPRFPSYLYAAEWERQMKQPSGYALSKQGLPISFMDAAEVPRGINLRNAWRREGAGGRSPSLQRIFEHLLQRFGGVHPVQADHLILTLQWLTEEGQYLRASELYGEREKAQLLQVNAEAVHLELVTSAMRYRCGVCGTPGTKADLPCPQCHGTLVHWSDKEISENRYVQRLQSQQIVPLEAGEHTAQVPNDERVKLESDFKASASEAKTNLLACSPTLEMGIDVGGLDAVLLRNVPPRPDNYAQRGGRAGRRTRVGLVVSYARSTPHDQYFYDKPSEMISGEVPAPALAIGNRDVIFRHLKAIAFGAASPGLSSRMLDYISPAGQINQSVVDDLVEGVRSQFDAALSLALSAWESQILEEAGLEIAQLRAELATLPAQIQDIIDRTARQVQELRSALEQFHQDLNGEKAALRAANLIQRILGIPSDKSNPSGSDDRSAGYPLRRFAEYGILPGYEFPTQPATLRLLGDLHEDDPVSVDRRLGINQFRPNAQVYARTRRWKVIGLDTASPWNPRSEAPALHYQLCQACGLRYNADEPACPRCHRSTPGKPLPAFEFAGFLARRDESPILDEEERYAARNLVQLFPQWNGQVVGRWQLASGWNLQLSRDEEVWWMNEGTEPTAKEREDGIPLLHTGAKGYLLCGNCGKILTPPLTTQASRGRRNARKQNHQPDPMGHTEQCPFVGQQPNPLAIATAAKAEVLRVLVPVPSSMSQEELQTWGLSLGYSLKAGMQHLYMLDGSEINFELEGAWKAETNGERYSLISLTFIDPSLGGSGYLRRIATEFDQVAKQALEHLDHPNCETACYRCLKTYQNQRFHDYLRWTIAVPTLEALSQSRPAVTSLHLKDLDDPRPWLEAYAAGVGSPLELKFLRQFEKYGFHPKKQVPIVLEPGSPPISIADFAVAEQRLAIYIDGVSFHQGTNLRRDRYIRDKLRHAAPPWKVIELSAKDLPLQSDLVEALKKVRLEER